MWVCEDWGHTAANCRDKLNRGAGRPAGSGKAMFNQGQTVKGALCVFILRTFSPLNLDF